MPSDSVSSRASCGEDEPPIARALDHAHDHLFDCPHAVFVLDVTAEGRFRIASFNAAEERLVGLSSAAASGRYVDELLPADVARPLLANYGRCVETRRLISYDEELDVPAGHRHCATTLVPVVDETGRVHRVIGVARDVTEERAAIAALRESEERFRQLAENIREVFWMTDAQKTEMLYISPAYEAIWGRTCESLRAAPSSWLDAIHPADRPRVEADLATQRETSWETTYRILRPDGSERWIRDRSFPVREEGDRGVRRIVGLAEDITQLVQAEERSRQSQKLEAIGLLAGGLAHDFNNVLSVILSYTQFLLEDLEPGDPRRTDVDQVREAGERARDLTRQLLAFSRNQTLEPRTLDLRESVRSLERMLRRVLAGSVDLVVVQGASLGAVRADPGQVDQVVLNLALNANDAMPNGGTLTIETSNVSLTPLQAAELGATAGPYVMLRVADDGTGMDAATRARVFEPFFTTKGVGKGTGLGLPTVLGIVRQSGGAVRIESAPGRGTSFAVYFPRTGDAMSTGSLRLPAPAPEGTETVLVVEDEEHVRALACTILRRAGYRVLEAQSAGDAILICEHHGAPIDLLLTDVVMPHLRGDKLATRLAPLRPKMRVLYMSGYAAAALGQNEAVDPLAFIQKPITPEALCRKVRAVLEQARA